MSVFTDLPIQIAFDVLGEWLRLKDLAQLDLAFCLSSQRAALHSVFRSPPGLLIQAPPTDPYSIDPEIMDDWLRWILARKCRSDVILFGGGSDLALWAEYLKMFGHHVKTARIKCNVHTTQDIADGLINSCPNISSLEWDCELSDSCVAALERCTKLQSVSINTPWTSNEAVPASIVVNSPLRLPSIELCCSKDYQEAFLARCSAEHVQRLRVSYWEIPDAERFVNLRSLGFSDRIDIQDEDILLELLSQCPWVVHLDLTRSGFLTDDSIVTILQSVQELRSFIAVSPHLSETSVVAYQEIVKYHKYSLEALLMFDNYCPAEGLNLVLAECPNLRTLSFSDEAEVDFSLMGNITSLMMDLPEDTDEEVECDGEGAAETQMWLDVQKHCRKLQRLCIALNWQEDYFNVDQMVTTVCDLPELHTLQFFRLPEDLFAEIVATLKTRRPQLNVSELWHETDWMKLFDMPI